MPDLNISHYSFSEKGSAYGTRHVGKIFVSHPEFLPFPFSAISGKDRRTPKTTVYGVLPASEHIIQA